MIDDRVLHLDRLRLAAAMTHSMPHVALELTLGHGPSVVISHDAAHHPDIGPCEFRKLIARVAAVGGPAVGFGWMHDISSVRLGGTGVTDDGSMVTVSSPTEDHVLTAFSTRLGDRAITNVAHTIATEFIQEQPAAIEALRDVRLKVYHDELLDASTVVLPWAVDSDPREWAVITGAIAQRCLVEELLAAPQIRCA